MATILVVLSAVFIVALSLHAYKKYLQMLAERMDQNEYDAAVTVWEYANLVNKQINAAVREGSDVLDFSKIAVPHSSGYKVSLELMGHYFRVHAVPADYNKTGRLSFYIDTTLSVRAADHAGLQASADDLEYKGESQA
jgi:hypothetical protein